MNKLNDLLYVRFSVPDLDAQAQFLENFGLSTFVEDDVLYGRGTDADPFVYCATQGEAKFLALGLEADSADALNQIAAIDDVAIEPSPLKGIESVATFIDPDGFTIELVHGVSRNDPLPVPTRNELNDGETRPRQGARVVFDDKPCTVKRLGHTVLSVSDFRASEAWYKERFGFLTSDEIFAGSEDNALGAFMRVDRGHEYVDHHTLFLLGTGSPGFNHAAFEIANWDSLMAGHYSLKEAGYQHSWGIGKHLLGSQVFDYWKDPSEFVLEHFTDGDLFDASFGPEKAPIDQLLGSHWGPEGGPT